MYDISAMWEWHVDLNGTAPYVSMRLLLGDAENLSLTLNPTGASLGGADNTTLV